MTLLAMSWERTQFAFILLALMELPSLVSRSLWLMWLFCMWRHTEFHPGAQHPGQLIKACPFHSLSMTGAVWVKDRYALCSCHGLCCTSNHAPPPPPAFSLNWGVKGKGIILAPGILCLLPSAGHRSLICAYRALSMYCSPHLSPRFPLTIEGPHEHT